MSNLSQRLLLALPPETAHDLAIRGLGILGALPGAIRPIAGRATTLCGLPLANPLGLAAGLDKDAQAVLGLARCGFAFVEVGTVTPFAQPGNPRPRLFRLPDHQALINRMGFNNLGVAQMARRLDSIRMSGRLSSTLLGVNLGKNKDTPLERAVDDYLFGMQRLHAYADYFTLNLSSPNTPGLRQLQHGEGLKTLLAQVKDCQLALASASKPVPLLLKVAPDLALEDIKQIAEVVRGAGIEGLIATNTTLAREKVSGHQHAEEAGGLSGQPLLETSLNVVASFRAALPKPFTIVGVGGIGSEEDASAMLAAGADALQIYSSFIYKGTELVHKIAKIQ